MAGPRHFSPALAAAEQIGGTRWIDDQTCQIQVDVDGKVVQELLLAAAADHPGRAPIPLNRLKARLAAWSSRSFSGTGTSTALAAAEQLRPDEQQSAWAGVRDEDRRAAIAAPDATRPLASSTAFARSRCQTGNLSATRWSSRVSSRPSAASLRVGPSRRWNFAMIWKFA